MIKVERDALKDALATVAPGIANNPHLPVLAGVHLSSEADRLHVRAMNLTSAASLSIVASCPASGEIEPIVVPAAALNDFVGRAGDVLELHEHDGHFVVASRRSRLEVRTFAAHDFPQSTVAEGDPVELSADVLARVGKILFAAHRNTKESRPILTGVHFGAGEAATTDSYRLAITPLPDEIPEALIHHEAVAAVVAAVGSNGCTLTVDGRHATFATDSASWTTRLIEGNFPNYRQLIPPETPQRLRIDRAAFRDAVELAKKFGVQLGLTPEDGELVVTTAQEGEHDLEMRLEAAEVPEQAVWVNAGFLRDMLAAGSDDEVTFRLVDPLKPIVVSEDGLTLLQMPVRVPGMR